MAASFRIAVWRVTNLRETFKNVGPKNKDNSHNEKKLKLLRTEVGVEEIAEVVSRATGIPVAKMMEGEKEKLLRMENLLHERIVGQDEAVSLVCDPIRWSRAGLADPGKPCGLFSF